MSSSVLQFAPFASSLTPDFWTAFTKLKIDALKLSESPVPLRGHYGPGKAVFDRESGQQLSLGASVHFDSNAFVQQEANRTNESSTSASAMQCSLNGTLLNFNTIEAFKAADKQALFEERATELWSRIANSESPTAAELNTILVVAFADLKKYAFFYWFAFPAFLAKPAWQLASPWFSLSSGFTESQVDAIDSAFLQYCQSPEIGAEERCACLLKPSTPADGYTAAKLSQCRAFFDNVPDDERFLLFVDPSSDGLAAGWPLRNLLAYLAVRHGVLRLKVICYRASRTESLTGTVWLDSALSYDSEKPTAVGWEKNTAGKLAPKLADLGALMDPKRLADQAVDLNLKLMKWRIMPGLDLEKIKRTKCLLLGAGTLGCYVSRSLMAWGVQQITLVDSGKVSFSNPVRQPLFEFTDCTNGGKPKAECAAEALRRIYPSIEAQGIQLAIPMPGHPVAPAHIETTEAAVRQLEELINQHDVIYLLMDSRESRWLPTLLAAEKGKLVINAALGFDTYLVMRHGMLSHKTDDRLGCYYCNDIVAPMDSLSDRTLDQMCTVTRPGLAAIASAIAVEMTTSVLQHALGPHAPCELERRPDGSVLGAVPHQIRGSLSDFSQLKIYGRAYSNCTACSDKVIAAYRKDGFSMLHQAFDDAKYLESITGLDILQAETEAVLEAVDWEEEGDDF